MNPVELEIIVDRNLRQLPAPRAPHTLLPRVLRAVDAWTRRPWYDRAWFTWPHGWQLASAAALVLIGVLLPGAWAVAAANASALTAPVIAEVAEALERTAVSVNAAGVLWRALVEPLVPYLFGVALLVMLMCLACAAFVAALNEVASGRILQR